MEIVHFLQGFASPTLDRIFYGITTLGDDRAYIVFLVATYVAVDAKVGRRIGVFLLIGFYLSFQLKALAATPRPYMLDPEVLRLTAALDTQLGAGGFPSNHAVGSLTLWGYLALNFRRRWFWIFALSLITLISLSRIYLGVHFLIDVLGGLAIAALFLAAIVYGEPLWSKLASLPSWLKLSLGLTLPFFVCIFLPPPGAEADMIMGGMAAFLTAPLIFRHRAAGPYWKRIVLAFLGIALVFAALTASSLLLPEALKRDLAVGFFRYLLIGYIGLVLTPWLGRLLHLTTAEPRSGAAT